MVSSPDQKSWLLPNHLSTACSYASKRTISQCGHSQAAISRKSSFAKQAGLLGKLKLTGLAPATLIKKYIQNGTVQDIWWNVKDLGYLTYYAAQAVGSGQISGKEGETFKAGRLGDYTVGPGGEAVLGPAKIVTSANVEEFKF